MTDEDVIVASVLRLLAERGQTLAIAESLTGGLVAARVSAVAGASRVFRGSVTAYASELKRDVLGVDSALLEERGAVDVEVARQMAWGARRALGADWGVATTGVAGPEPQDGQSVGTVFVAVAGPDTDEAVGTGHEDPRALRLSLTGERGSIREASVDAVLRLLRDELTWNAAAQDTEQGGENGCLQP